MTQYTLAQARELADAPLHMSVEPLRAALRSLADQLEQALSHPKSIEADPLPVVCIGLQETRNYLHDWGCLSHDGVRELLESAERAAAPVVPAPVARPAPFHPSASHIDPEYRDGWNAALAATQPQAAPVAQLSEPPEGWKWVPIVPTDAMRDAGNVIVGSRSKLFAAWRQMLATAPTTPKEAG